MPVVSSWRLTRVNLLGAAMVTVVGRTAITAISTSPLAVPVGRAITIELAWPFWSVEAALWNAMAASAATGATRQATPTSARPSHADPTK